MKLDLHHFPLNLPGFRSKSLRLVGVASVVAIPLCAAIFAWLVPDDPADEFHAALAALEEGDLQYVFDTSKHLRHEPGFQKHAELLRGALELKTKRYAAALQHFSGVEPRGELRELSLLMTGEALYHTGQLVYAERCFLDAVDSDISRKGRAHALRWLAAINYDIGNTVLALEQLEELASREPTDYRPHLLMAQIRSDRDLVAEYGRAAEHYREVLDRAPPEPIREEVTLKLAAILAREKRDFEAALQLLAQLPRHPDALALNGECQWALQNETGAFDSLAEALTLQADHPAALLNQGRFLLQAGRAEEAVPLLERVARQDRFEFEPQHQLAMAYRAAGRTDDYERQLKVQEDSRQKRLEMSRLNTEATQRPFDPQPRLQLAALCRSIGKHDLAAMWDRAAEACRQRRNWMKDQAEPQHDAKR